MNLQSFIRTKCT